MLSSTVSTGQRHIADFIFVLYFYMVSFNPSYVGYIYSLGSIVVPKHKPTSGSGDLSPTLGEEVCAPLCFKTSVLLAFLNSQQSNTVLVNVETMSLVSPQPLLYFANTPQAQSHRHKHTVNLQGYQTISDWKRLAKHFGFATMSQVCETKL